MSFQGTIEANCPSCTDGFDAPIWSFVHGGKDQLLRDQAKTMEVNLLLCPSCGAAFLPEAAWIYYEPDEELLAFVFPTTYKAEETKWRDKMKADFAAMREALDTSLPVGHEPEVFFGPDGLASLLEKIDWSRDERDVMAFVAAELKLPIYKASPSWARAHGAPAWLPYAGKSATRDSVVAGVKKLVAANDRLTTWSNFLAALEKDPRAALPPAALARK